MHFLGPEDPRLDRFCRILARAGWLVGMPSLSACRDLLPDHSVPDDFAAAFTLLRAQPGVPKTRTGLFSISFGAMPALHVAAHPDYADQLGGLVVFGGYADWQTAIRYVLDAPPDDSARIPPPNPLIRPVAFMNLLPSLPHQPGDAHALCSAWRAYVHETWLDPDFQDPARHRPIALRIADTLPPGAQALFLQGCGMGTQGNDTALSALRTQAEQQEALMDLRQQLPKIRCPVTLVHGVSDDIIPHTQLDVLANGLQHVPFLQVLRTGLYGHSSAGQPSPLAVLREVRTLLRVLNGIAIAATDAHRAR